MATLDELSRALIAADKAGDAQAARILAGEIRRVRAPADNLNAETLNPTTGMSGADKFFAGAGKAVVDTGRGLGQMMGLVSREDVAESRKRDAALMDTGMGMAGNIGGNVAMALSPGMAAKGLSMVPALARAAPALNAAGSALMAPRTIGGAAALGAGMGLVQPSTSTGETLGNMALGGVASAAVPTVIRGLQSAKAAAEPFYQAGQDRIMGRLLQKVAGNDAPAVASRLRESSAPFVGPSLQGEARSVMGEIVPGSVPTLGQAAGNPGIAALERTLSATSPEVGQAVGGRMAAQNTARVDALGNMAGTDGARAFYDASRSAAADDLYDAAYKAGVDLRRNAATGQFLNKSQQAGRKGEITRLMDTPAMQEAAQRAQNLMRNDPNLKGQVLNPSGSVQGLDYTRRALSDMIGDAKGNEQRILINLRERLDTTLNTISPKYAEARTTFQSMSRPINQMDVAQEIADKSINRLTGNMQPLAFARALDDSTAARATGFRGATLENTMDPRQLQQLNAIREDLARKVAAETAGRGVGSDTIQKLAYSNMIDAAGVPSWMRNMPGMQVVGNLAGRGADAIYGRANREMAGRLADAAIEPSTIARLLTMATETPNAPFSDILAKLLAPGALALPSVVNAQKQ